MFKWVKANRFGKDTKHGLIEQALFQLVFIFENS